MKTTCTKTPSPSTRAAILALLRADPGVTAAHRKRVLAAFDAPTTARPPKGWLPVSEVAGALGVHVTSIIRWADKGRIRCHRLGARLTLVQPDEVAAHIQAHPPKRRTPAQQQQQAGQGGDEVPVVDKVPGEAPAGTGNFSA